MDFKDIGSLLSQILTNPSHNNIHKPINTRLLEEISREERKVETTLKKVEGEIERAISPEKETNVQEIQIGILLLDFNKNPIIIKTKGNIEMSFTLTDSQATTLTAVVLDKMGHDTQTLGLTWSSSNPAVASVSPAADSKSAVVLAEGLGTTVITVTTNTGISATFDISVVAGAPVSITIEASAPVEAPAPVAEVVEPAPVTPAPAA